MTIQNINTQLNNLNVGEAGCDMVNMDQLSSLNELDSSSMGFLAQGVHDVIDPINGYESQMNIQAAESFSGQKKLVEFQDLMMEYSTNVTVVSKVVGISIKGLNELLHPQ